MRIRMTTKRSRALWQAEELKKWKRVFVILPVPVSGTKEYPRENKPYTMEHRFLQFVERRYPEAEVWSTSDDVHAGRPEYRLI